ncbi:MAG: methyltransferase domain-containing protein, partial [Acidimicrobiales bacterium]
IRRCDGYGLSDQVSLVHGDILSLDLPHAFDIVHSREVFLHIHDKATLFETLHRALNAGGQLLFTDYCCGPDKASETFQAYLDEFGYDLRRVDVIGSLLIEAGFAGVQATDITHQFIEIHQRELDQLANSGLSEASQEELRIGWLAKIERAERGEQRWGLFQARVE